MRLSNWKEARIVADTLKKWLGEHCSNCGQKLTKMCLDGGRCLHCGAMIGQAEGLAQLVDDARVWKKAR